MKIKIQLMFYITRKKEVKQKKKYHPEKNNNLILLNYISILYKNRNKNYKINKKKLFVSHKIIKIKPMKSLKTKEGVKEGVIYQLEVKKTYIHLVMILLIHNNLLVILNYFRLVLRLFLLENRHFWKNRLYYKI